MEVGSDIRVPPTASRRASLKEFTPPLPRYPHLGLHICPQNKHVNCMLKGSARMGLEDLQYPAGISFKEKLAVAKRLTIEKAKRKGLRPKFVRSAGQTSTVASMHQLQAASKPSSKALPQSQAKPEAAHHDTASDRPCAMVSSVKNTRTVSSNPYAGLTSAKKRRFSLDISDQHKDQSEKATGAAALGIDDSDHEPLAEQHRFGPPKRQRKRTQQTYGSM